MATGFTKWLVYDPSKILPEEGGGGGYCNIKTPTSYSKLTDPRPKLKNNSIPVLIIKRTTKKTKSEPVITTGTTGKPPA
jgi:hypothetical protein